MSYLKHKPGSIEELVQAEASKLNDSAYQDMFKKELDKAGKGIGGMSPKEKKDFFNKIDDKYKAKNEELSAAQKKLPPALQKAIAKKDSAKNEGGPPADGGPGSGGHNKDGASKSGDKKTSSSGSKSDLRKALNSVPEPGSDYDPTDYSRIKGMAKKTGDTTTANLITKMNKAHNDMDDDSVEKHYKDLKKHLGEGEMPKAALDALKKSQDKKEEVPAGSHKMPDGTIMKDKDHKKEDLDSKELQTKKTDGYKSSNESWRQAWEEATKDKSLPKDEANDVDQGDEKKPVSNKDAKKLADSGSKLTKVETEPEADFKN